MEHNLLQNAVVYLGAAVLVVPLAKSDPARRRVAYPEFGLAVDHLRVEDIDPALAPAWLDLA